MAIPLLQVANPVGGPVFDQSHADPGAFAAQAEANAQGAQQVGHSTNEMLFHMNMADVEAQKAAYRQQKQVEANQAKAAMEAQRQKASQDKLYTSYSAIMMQQDGYKMANSLRSQVAPGGDQSKVMADGMQSIAQQYMANAPSPEAATQVGLHGLKLQTGYMKFGDALQRNSNTEYVGNQLSELSKNQNFQATQHPEQLSDLIGQLQDYRQAAIDSGIPAKNLDHIYENATSAVTKNGLLAWADKDPQAALAEAQSGKYPGVNETLLTQIQKRGQNKTVNLSAQSEYDLGNIEKTLNNHMQAPEGADQTFQQALNTADYLSQDPTKALQAQKILDKVQVLQGTIKAQQDLVGKSPQELQQRQIDMYSNDAQQPGDPIAAQVQANELKAIQFRQKLYKNNPGTVEEIDGTLPKMVQAPSTDLLKDPQALQQFASERINRQTVLASKYGQRSSLPFTDQEIDGIKDQVAGQSPTAQMKSLGYLNALPADMAEQVINKVNDKDTQVPTALALRLGAYNPKLGNDIAQGLELMKGGNAEKMGLPNITERANQLGDTFINDPKAEVQYTQAARALANKRLTTGEATDPAEAFKGALSEVSGVQKVGGGWFSGPSAYHTVMPFVPASQAVQPGQTPDPLAPKYRRMTTDEFTQTVAGIKDADTFSNYSSGTPVDPISGHTLDPASTSLSNFQFKPADTNGKYILYSNGHAMRSDEDGSPVTFDMKDYLEDHPLPAGN